MASKKFAKTNEQVKAAAQTASPLVILERRVNAVCLEVKQHPESPGILENCFSQKSVEQMLRKHMGMTVEKEAKKPRECIELATIRNVKEAVSVPPTGFKKAMVTAAAGVKGLTMKRLMTQIYVRGGSVPIQYEEMVPMMHMVRLGDRARTPDVRFRPCFVNWTARVYIEYVEPLNAQTVVDLLQRAGGIGLCEWRPERGGIFGMFYVTRAILDRKEIAEVRELCTPPIKPLVIPDWAMDVDISPELLKRIAAGQHTVRDDETSIEGEDVVSEEALDEDVADLEPKAVADKIRGRGTRRPRKGNGARAQL